MRFAEHPPSSPYQQGLDRNPANYAPLTPLSFLERAADVYPQRTAWIHGAKHTSYADFRARCRRLAAALAARGVRPGDTVTVMAPNIPAALEAALWRADGRRGPQRAQRPARGGQHRLHPRPQRIEGAADRHRIFAPVIEDALGRCKARPQVIDIVDDLFFGGEVPGRAARRDDL